MQSEKMDYSLAILLMPHNYFKWKLKIMHQLRCRGFYWITMATEVEPTSTFDKKMYFNHMDEAYTLLCVSMSLELMFHIESCTTPYEIWEKLEDIFGK